MITYRTIFIWICILKYLSPIVDGHHLGDGVSFEWQVDNDNDYESIKMTFKIPESFKWIAFGFHMIPFLRITSEDMGLISIRMVRKGVYPILKTIHLDSNGDIELPKTSLYEWEEKLRMSRYFMFSVSRELGDLPIDSPVNFVWAYGNETNFAKLEGKFTSLFKSAPITLEHPDVFLKNDPSVQPDVPLFPTLEAKTTSIESKFSESNKKDSVDRDERPANSENTVETSGVDESVKGTALDSNGKGGSNNDPSDNFSTGKVNGGSGVVVDSRNETMIVSTPENYSESRFKESVIESNTRGRINNTDSRKLLSTDSHEAKVNNDERHLNNQDRNIKTDIESINYDQNIISVKTTPTIDIGDSNSGMDTADVANGRNRNSHTGISKDHSAVKNVVIANGKEQSSYGGISKENPGVGGAVAANGRDYYGGMAKDLDVVTNRDFINVKETFSPTIESLQVPKSYETTHTSKANNITASSTKKECSCSENKRSWYDVFKDNENTVYIAVIGISAFFTGVIVLCLACCCAKRPRKIPRTRKAKAAFYQVDDYESSGDEEVEFLRENDGMKINIRDGT